MNDNVNNPKHYTSDPSGIEHIEQDNDMGDDTHIENHVSPLCKAGGEVMRSGFEEYYSTKYPNDDCTLMRNGNYSGWLKQQLWEQWQHQQSKIDELQYKAKLRESDHQALLVKYQATKKCWEDMSNEKDELQKRMDAAQKLIDDWNFGGVNLFDLLDELEQALKGGNQ